MKTYYHSLIATTAALLTLFIGLGIPAEATEKTSDALAGVWGGELDTGGIKLALTFEIEAQADGTYSAKLRVPIQTNQAIPVSNVKVNDAEISLEVAIIGGRFDGKQTEDKNMLEGIWSQGGQNFPLSLTRGKTAAAPRRPQTPKPPFPYQSEEVTFGGANSSHRLAGTLTLPVDTEHAVAAVVLISGSGPQDRDETILGHRPFAVIADRLTRLGIAVLRYDDRGVGKSTGDFESATSEDFANDAAAAMDFLLKRSEIDPHRIGLIGHSEGGLIAPMVASTREDVAFVVLLAGPGVRGDETLISQSITMAEANGAPAELITIYRQFWRSVFDLLLAEPVDTRALQQLGETFHQEVEAIDPEYLKIIGAKDDLWAGQMEFLTSPWFRFFLALDPAVALENLTCPGLALNGTLDMQVLADLHLPAIKRHLTTGGNSAFRVQRMQGLNHLFQNAKTGLPSEYAEIEETIDPATLTIISDWIIATTAPR